MRNIILSIAALCCVALLAGCDKDNENTDKAVSKGLSSGIWLADDSSLNICFFSLDKESGSGYGLLVPGARRYATAFKWSIYDNELKKLILTYIKYNSSTRQYESVDGEQELVTLDMDGDRIKFKADSDKNRHIKGELTFHRLERGDYYASNMLLPAVWDYSKGEEGILNSSVTNNYTLYVFGEAAGEAAYLPSTIDTNPLNAAMGRDPVTLSKRPGVIFRHDPKKGTFSADIVMYDDTEGASTLVETVEVKVKNEGNLPKMTVSMPGVIRRVIKRDEPVLHSPDYGTPPMNY